MYQILIEEIEQTRTLMIQTAVREGMTSPNTLQVSQSLDALLNKLQSFFYQ
ncbi:aspartyl-phosphate phosphatase Spo0E family protein [Priestia aryabhattai]|uniref:aspartyl-phosphate phosphatase Spo0E family protein n=2 Tax=Bacillaceae TaxID=186817 RepID=UPI002015F020|nr:aspartyl-phosphate phosphatase Spo0E family protein [Priestia aryabhattai]MED4153454.1 aspartyl-phosphate phosphatase Spo0E family protein [Priestia aryabhattai]